MDILWAAAGICAIVFVVFFALAQHWQRILKQQSLTIRRLSERLRDMQDLGDPEFRRRVSEEAPVPLDQVFHFSLHFDERFWREQLHVGPAEWKFIQTHGSFIGSVKLERWRSHIVATVAEILPHSSMARWQNRTMDFYPDYGRRGDSITLWDLRLAPTNGTAEKKPTLELNLRSDALELSAHHLVVDGIHSGNRCESTQAERIFFKVPLDTALLSKFRSADPAQDVPSNGASAANRTGHGDETSWKGFYTFRDDALGIEWQLRLHDLGKKAQWERWKILESPVAPMDFPD